MTPFRTLLALVLVPPLLAVPVVSAAASGAPTTSRVSATDLSARTRLVLGLANRDRVGDLARYADADTVDFLVDRSWPTTYPPCRTSTVSTPSRPVYVCRVVEADSLVHRVPDSWWIYYVQVDGRWTAVNHRFARSASEWQTRANLAARGDKIYALGWADDWDAVATYFDETRHVDFLRSTFTELKDAGTTAPPTASPCRRTDPDWVDRLGSYYCAFPSSFSQDRETALTFRRTGGHWRAGLGEVPFNP